MAAVIGRNVAPVKFIVPGLTINKTPAIPIIKADHRRNPTTSFRNRTENKVIISGATKKIAELSPNGINARPEKKERLARTRHEPDIMCKPGRSVIRAERPPSIGRKINNVKINAIRARKNTT